MNELDKGQAKLTDFQGKELFKVEYSITFTTTLRSVKRGFPPVVNVEAQVAYIRALDGKEIPPGEYLLEREIEINRVKRSFVGWHVLSWPP